MVETRVLGIWRCLLQRRHAPRCRRPGDIIVLDKTYMRNIRIFWISRHTRDMTAKLYGDHEKGGILLNPDLEPHPPPVRNHEHRSHTMTHAIDYAVCINFEPVSLALDMDQRSGYRSGGSSKQLFRNSTFERRSTSNADSATLSCLTSVAMILTSKEDQASRVPRSEPRISPILTTREMPTSRQVVRSSVQHDEV